MARRFLGVLQQGRHAVLADRRCHRRRVRPRLPEPAVHPRLPPLRRRQRRSPTSCDMKKPAQLALAVLVAVVLVPILGRAQHLLPGGHLPDRGLLGPGPRASISWWASPACSTSATWPSTRWAPTSGASSAPSSPSSSTRYPAPRRPARPSSWRPTGSTSSCSSAIIVAAIVGLILGLPGAARPRRLPGHHHPGLRRDRPPAREQPRQAPQPHERAPGHHADPAADPAQELLAFFNRSSSRWSGTR